MKFLFVILFLGQATAWAETAKLSVNGMVCAFCAQGIKKKFSTNAKVENVSVDLDEKLVTVTIKKGAKLSDEVLTNLIKDAGYAVTKIERKE